MMLTLSFMISIQVDLRAIFSGSFFLANLIVLLIKLTHNGIRENESTG